MAVSRSIYDLFDMLCNCLYGKKNPCTEEIISIENFVKLSHELFQKMILLIIQKQLNVKRDSYCILIHKKPISINVVRYKITRCRHRICRIVADPSRPVAAFKSSFLYLAFRDCDNVDYKEKILASSGNFKHPSDPSSHLHRLPGKRPSAVRAAADGLYAITLDMGQT